MFADWDQEYVLVSDDPAELEAEIERLRKENEAMRSAIEDVADTAEQGNQLLMEESQRPDAASGSGPQGSASPTGSTSASTSQAVRKKETAAAAVAAEKVSTEELLREFQRVRAKIKGRGSKEREAETQEPAGSVAAPQASSSAVSAPSGSASGATSAAASLQRQPSTVKATSAPASSKAAKQKGDPVVEQTDDPMDIVFVSAEVAPWSKTGGLGDVVGSLPIALAARGHRVMVVAPRYLNGKSDDLYESAKDLHSPLTLDLGACGEQTVSFYHVHKLHVDFVFVDHPCYHRAGNPYGDEHGVFGDNQFRYALLSLAACEAPLTLNIGGYRSGEPPGFPYGDRCMFVANDWHAGLVPAYLAGRYRRNGVYKDARSVFAIHNLSHQGVEPASTYGNLGLPDDWYDPLSWRYPDWASINGPAVNILKGGVVASDRVVTVSQGYAWEITTAEGGWGLDGVLKERQHVLNGITNGIDMVEWDPSTDEFTAAHYNADDLSGKAECKAALQRELGFDVDPKKPLVGWIGRLDHQKGPDITLDSVPEMAARGCQFVMLGSGDAKYEAQMREHEEHFKANYRGWVGFSIPVAHRIIAGCDVLLMPSRFEPCGLNQLFAMRYGTVPVAHATGGLRDTIQNFKEDAQGKERGTGWTFNPPDVPTMMRTMDHVLHVYHDKPQVWREVMRNGMGKDLSWNKAAKEYEQIFKWSRLDPAVRPW
ncbi:hypothetical protein WJX72_009092 [[Myrmecia] bisecta]|uniref:starch synthase n=1 Tax=[Myrmecia] bisecta TaxID=41462 RepID=A0AAW1P6Z6_9CHLO